MDKKKAIKIKPIKSWNKTLEKVQKYNTKRRRETLESITNSLKNIDWNQGKSNGDSGEDRGISLESTLENKQETSEIFETSLTEPILTENSSSEIDSTNNNEIGITTTDNFQSIVSTPQLSTAESIRENLDPLVQQKLPNQVIVSAHRVQASISGTEMRKNFLFYYTVYRIQILWVDTNKCYEIFRSYSDFRDLDSKLRQLLREPWEEGFPEFPTSRWFGTMEADYVIFLMSQLREYLYKVLRIPALTHTRIISEFLREDNNK